MFTVDPLPSLPASTNDGALADSGLPARFGQRNNSGSGGGGPDWSSPRYEDDGGDLMDVDDVAPPPHDAGHGQTDDGIYL